MAFYLYKKIRFLKSNFDYYFDNLNINFAIFLMKYYKLLISYF